MRAPRSRGRQRMVPLRSAGRTAYRGRKPPQRCRPQHDRPSRGSDKSARPATIFIHNGAPQALVGCLVLAMRPLVDLLARHIPLDAVALLDSAFQLFPFAVNEGEIVVSQLAPLLLHLALGLL